jgi:hypothetical protein
MAAVNKTGAWLINFLLVGRERPYNNNKEVLDDKRVDNEWSRAINYPSCISTTFHQLQVSAFPITRSDDGASLQIQKLVNRGNSYVLSPYSSYNTHWL